MITLELNKANFQPGEQIAGSVLWQMEKEPKKLEIRLFWYTKGKGTEDALITDAKEVIPVSVQGTQEFSFILPKYPYSFSGKLISLIWAIEFVAEPSAENARKEFVMAPQGIEINL